MEYLENLKMCLLTSRSQLCVNLKVKEAVGDRSIDEICRESVDASSCSYAFKSSAVAEQLSKDVVWDIEDAVRVGQKQRGCPYYASHAALEEATFIFAPYNFLLDCNIRATLGINLEESTVIFDEAHNIEDCSRGFASFSITKSKLQSVLVQLESLSRSGMVSFSSLHTMMTGIFEWFQRMISVLTPEAYKSHHNVWSGEEIKEIFESGFSLTKDSLTVYYEHLKSVLKDNEDIANLFGSKEGNDERVEVAFEETTAKISASVSFVLKDLFKVLNYLYDDDPRNVGSFKIAIVPETTSRGKKSDFQVALNIWCLNSAVVFREIGEKAHSVLLTSGTLSPFDSFAGELGVSFLVRLEASHVINTKKQVFATIVSSARGVQFDSTFSNKDNTAYHDVLGDTLLQIANSTPGGTLVFLPSYSFLDRLYIRWNDEGIITALQDSNIEVFTEPKLAKDLEDILTSFYESIDRTDGKAVFLAVCRGKVSEGINFSDRYARAVMIIGIPYPSVADLQIQLKREYQDKAKQLNPV